MTQEKQLPKSLVDQILDETLASVEGRPEFNAIVIQELKRLAQGGDLKKAAQVTKAIKSGQDPTP